MPCIPEETKQTPEFRERTAALLARLEGALAAGTVSAVIGPQGGIAFRGWKDNGGISDLCAYRKLSAANSPALRKAMARAEVMAGRQVDRAQIAAGTHSHDGGATWSRHP